LFVLDYRNRAVFDGSAQPGPCSACARANPLNDFGPRRRIQRVQPHGMKAMS
jgi:hypothetical protein